MENKRYSITFFLLFKSTFLGLTYVYMYSSQSVAAVSTPSALLGNIQKWKFTGPTPELVNEKLWQWGPAGLWVILTHPQVGECMIF